MKSKRLDRTVLLLGAGLIVVAFVAMNVRPFVYGDTRIFRLDCRQQHPDRAVTR